MSRSEYLYFRDNKQVTEEEWWKCLNEDINILQRKHNLYEIQTAVYADINNGHNYTVVNQHQYTRKPNCLTRERSLLNGRVC